jgi:hypothetical protein
MGVKGERPVTLCRSDVIDLDGPERIIAGEHRRELRTELRSFKGAIPEFPERNASRVIARDFEHRVERAIAGLDPLIPAQDDQRIPDGIEDRLRALALVNGVADAGAEGSHIRERQHRAGDLPIALDIGRDVDNKPPLPVAEVDLRCRSAGDDLAAVLGSRRIPGDRVRNGRCPTARGPARRRPC